MTLAIKSVGFGRWVIMDGDRKVSAPMTKDEAVAMARKPLAAVVPAGVEREATLAEIRETQHRLNTQIIQQRSALSAKVKAILVEEFGEDKAQMMMPRLEPILNDPNNQLGRRERPRYIQPVKAAATAA